MMIDTIVAIYCLEISFRISQFLAVKVSTFPLLSRLGYKVRGV
jgi:hypothetical protein